MSSFDYQRYERKEKLCAVSILIGALLVLVGLLWNILSPEGMGDQVLILLGFAVVVLTIAKWPKLSDFYRSK
jgi:hypothetical protein